MSRKRVVFLGGKSIGAFCLQHLIEQQELYAIDIVAAMTKQNKALDNADTVYSICNENGIELCKQLKDIPFCDIIISVQYHEILKQIDIDKAKEVAVNLHMAPLPEYRGCNQFSFAIIDKKKEFGTTLHVMTPGIDDGDIIAERRFVVKENCWVEELYKKTFEESKLLFVNQIVSIINNQFKTQKQSSLIAERGSSYHFRNEIKALKIIDESWPEEKKALHVRATFMGGFEPPYSVVNGEKKYYDKNSF